MILISKSKTASLPEKVQDVNDLRRSWLTCDPVGVEQSVIDDIIDGAANREMELPIVGHDIILDVCEKIQTVQTANTCKCCSFYKCIILSAQIILNYWRALASAVVCRPMRIQWASNDDFAGESDFDGWLREISQLSTSSYPWNQRASELDRKAPKRSRFHGQSPCLPVL